MATVNLIVKARSLGTAVMAFQQHFPTTPARYTATHSGEVTINADCDEALLNEWMAEDAGHGAPYPSGSLLFWAIAEKVRKD